MEYSISHSPGSIVYLKDVAYVFDVTDTFEALRRYAWKNTPEDFTSDSIEVLFGGKLAIKLRDGVFDIFAPGYWGEYSECLWWGIGEPTRDDRRAAWLALARKRGPAIMPSSRLGYHGDPFEGLYGCKLIEVRSSDGVFSRVSGYTPRDYWFGNDCPLPIISAPIEESNGGNHLWVKRHKLRRVV